MTRPSKLHAAAKITLAGRGIPPPTSWAELARRPMDSSQACYRWAKTGKRMEPEYKGAYCCCSWYAPPPAASLPAGACEGGLVSGHGSDCAVALPDAVDDGVLHHQPRRPDRAPTRWR